MIAKIIEFSVRNRWLVILVWLGVAIWGLYAVVHTPVDAIPDLSENQVIVFADWMGRSPQDIEEQVTYPLSVQLQGLAGVKAIRSSSEPNFSMINIIFDDTTDFYFARTRVLEKLTTAKANLPAEVTPILAPDATALGQIFWYTVEGEGKSIDELRAIQDFTVRYQLNSLSGVAEVASVGGFVRQYQVDVSPAKLRLYDLPLSSVYSAISSSNMIVGGKAISTSNSEYLIRSIGWIKGVEDLENVVVTSRAGVPIQVKDVATVQLGPEFRRSALEKDGEAVGGVVMMRVGENPLEVTKAIKQRIREMQAGLPAGVRVVPFYDRTRLIESAIHTVTGTLREEMIIASIAILLILTHFRSAIVVCMTLPMAVLISFLFMYYLNIPSNIMSLSGIAISIGILVDAAVVMVENASHELKQHFDLQTGEKTSTQLVSPEKTSTQLVSSSRKRGLVHGDTTEIVIRSCRLVGRPIFFSVLIMLLSFLPVFAFGGQEGKLSHPLAYTKSFAMIGVAILAITLVPATIPLLIRGKLKGEDENWIVRSFIHIYRPVITYAIERPGLVWWMMAIILSLGAGFIASSWAASIVLAGGMCFVLLGVQKRKWRAIAVASLILIAFFADSRFGKLGSEFMPELDEGAILDMPQTAPRVPMAQAVDDVTVRDRILRTFPEVEQAVGKIGRADTATDPSPVDMVETIVSMKPPGQWPKRKINFEDALAQAKVVADEMERRGWLKAGDRTELINSATPNAIEQFDRTMRDLARRRQIEFEPILADKLARTAIDDLLEQASARSALLKRPGDAEIHSVIASVKKHATLIAQLPRQEEVDALLLALRVELVKDGFIADRNDLLVDAPNAINNTIDFICRAVGSERASLSERVMRHLEKHRDELWAQRTKELNWELFDYGKVAINDILFDVLYNAAANGPLAGAEPNPQGLASSRESLTKDLETRLLLWTKTKSDIVTEMGTELQMPGWANSWTQPIINRVNMLATGVRAPIGVKIYGPSGKPLPEAIQDVQRVSQESAAKLKTVYGAADVIAEQATGKRYVEITVNRENAARYGVNVADISQAVEVAMGGANVTTTVEGRQRFPVQLRYARENWQDIDALGDVLVNGRTTAASLSRSAKPQAAKDASLNQGNSEMKADAAGGVAASAAMSSPASFEMPASGSMIQIPLRLVADIHIVDGPAMIKSENGRLRNYVTLFVRDRDIVGFVEEARQAIKPIEARLAGTGMSIEWSGEFESQVRARQTLLIIFPMVIVLILLLLYITFKDMLDTLLVFLAVLGALAGAVMFQALFGFNFSVIVSIGYIAAFGMATQTGVIMLVYLRESLDKRGGLSAIRSLDELRSAVIEGAVHRLRPKLLTEGVAIVGLVPMLWAAGTGAEIMRPMAAPVLGGLLISDEVIDLMIPVLFYWIRRRRWLTLHAPEQQNLNISLPSDAASPVSQPSALAPSRAGV
jgi:Cu(I)/Ag(I) efflux system membrane protein CusA/SilA